MKPSQITSRGSFHRNLSSPLIPAFIIHESHRLTDSVVYLSETDRVSNITTVNTFKYSHCTVTCSLFQPEPGINPNVCSDLSFLRLSCFLEINMSAVYSVLMLTLAHQLAVSVSTVSFVSAVESVHTERIGQEIICSSSRSKNRFNLMRMKMKGLFLPTVGQFDQTAAGKHRNSPTGTSSNPQRPGSCHR